MSMQRELVDSGGREECNGKLGVRTEKEKNRVNSVGSPVKGGPFEQPLWLGLRGGGISG